jgi:hypothetical protein
VNPIIALAIALGIGDALVSRAREQPEDQDLLDELGRELERRGGIPDIDFKKEWGELDAPDLRDEEIRSPLLAIGPSAKSGLEVDLLEGEWELGDGDVALLLIPPDVASLDGNFRSELKKRGRDMAIAYALGDNVQLRRLVDQAWASAAYPPVWATAEQTYEMGESGFFDDILNTLSDWEVDTVLEDGHYWNVGLDQYEVASRANDAWADFWHTDENIEEALADRYHTMLADKVEDAREELEDLAAEEDDE